MNNQIQVGISRGVMSIAEKIRAAIESGRYPAGKLMPGLRNLSVEHGAAQKTIQRSMAVLIAEGRVSVESRRGYRVLGDPAQAQRAHPLAYIAALSGGPECWNDVHQQLLLAFQTAAQARGWPLLAIGSADQPPSDVMRQTTSAQAWGLILDTIDPVLLSMVRSAGIPAVMADAWVEDVGFDAIVQDGFQGGLLAATYLVSRGRRRVAWLGPTIQQSHSLARLSGALAGLLRAGLELERDHRIDVPDLYAPDLALQKARELLSRPDRPDGVLTLWQTMTIALASAAHELRLVPGRDFDLVGWCTEEEYAHFTRKTFADNPVPPMAVWSVRAMADLAVSRLAERRSHPGLAAVRVNVPVSLRIAPLDGAGTAP